MIETQAQFNASLATHMQSVLDGIAQTFGQAGVDLPERQYTTFGEAAHDCQQVTVGFEQMYLGPPGDQAQTPQKCTAPRTVVLLVEIVRCIPVLGTRGTPLDLDLLSTTAEQQAIDVWLLMESAAQHATYLGALADITVTPPSGGFQAVSMSLIMAVE